MKIAITATEADIESTLDDRFGRAAYFAIVSVDESEDKEIEFFENSAKDENSGAGVKTVKNLADLGVDTVIIKGEIGPKAWAVIQEFGIKVYDSSTYKTVKTALLAFEIGNLSTVEEPKRGLRRA